MENSNNTNGQITELETRLEGKIEDIRTAIVQLTKKMATAFEIVDKNFESLESRINVIDGKIDQLAQNSSKEFESVGDKLTDLKNEVTKIQKVSNYSEEYANLLKISK
jgi:hypothetical protein